MFQIADGEFYLDHIFADVLLKKEYDVLLVVFRRSVWRVETTDYGIPQMTGDIARYLEEMGLFGCRLGLPFPCTFWKTIGELDLSVPLYAVFLLIKSFVRQNAPGEVCQRRLPQTESTSSGCL